MALIRPLLTEKIGGIEGPPKSKLGRRVLLLLAGATRVCVPVVQIHNIPFIPEESPGHVHSVLPICLSFLVDEAASLGPAGQDRIHDWVAAEHWSSRLM